MISRYVGSSLGLLAFAIAAAGGLYAQNPPMVVLSRSVLALFIFFFIGLVLGSVAQMVISEYGDTSKGQIEEQYRQDVLEQQLPDADITVAGMDDSETAVA